MTSNFYVNGSHNALVGQHLSSVKSVHLEAAIRAYSNEK